MQIKVKAFGNTQTNCYIATLEQGDLIIDPGFGAAKWVLENAQKPLAILITHGHYDHIWDAHALKNALPNVPLYAPKSDIFMLTSDCFSLGLTPCLEEEICPVECQRASTTLRIDNVPITYWHFPGHTPGCSMVEIENVFFSGDFIFYRSIGRYDFPYSNPTDMKDSLIRFENLESSQDKPIYPGHGQSTSLKAEQPHMKVWVAHL
ncbi:MBL fold metallo-hydrolase [Helicobacter baculiformis]|uniref:MBL fold metallo-hydrolase n=1 Tax=Helicobacter baculiformis TaxID=427351 RepID=A0ABV7ZIR5_9HELI|nr:MBL fold metallo-hydrolase [Helicobacter baculiformis]